MQVVTLDEGHNYVTSAQVHDSGVVLTFQSKVTGKRDQILLSADEMEETLIWSQSLVPVNGEETKMLEARNSVTDQGEPVIRLRLLGTGGIGVIRERFVPASWQWAEVEKAAWELV